MIRLISSMRDISLRLFSSGKALALELIPFFKASAWCGCMLLFGLLQLWSVLGYSRLDNKAFFDGNKFLVDCGLVFFSTALVVGFAIDFFFQDRKRVKSLIYIGAIYVLYPILILVVAVAIYGVCFLGQPDINLLLSMQLVIVFMSVLYALVLKTMHFTK